MCSFRFEVEVFAGDSSFIIGLGKVCWTLVDALVMHILEVLTNGNAARRQKAVL